MPVLAIRRRSVADAPDSKAISLKLPYTVLALFI
jgi:hypothetical protein